MKFVLIDTNIFLDMLIDRKNQVSSNLVESFVKLLDYNEIKVLVPEIIIHETHKHIDDELDKVRGKLEVAIKDIDKLYGVNAYTIDCLDIKEYKRKSKTALQDAIDMFDQNKTAYQTEITSLINKIFKHSNAVIIGDDDKLISLCMKRCVYKKAPFHIKGKDSLADGIITEILINITSIVKINKDDEIFFVTGNHTDFSESGDKVGKNNLHPHIVEDLDKQLIKDKVTYVTSFHQLISESLKNEVENADLKENFQCQLEEQEEYMRMMEEAEYSDIVRERFGLSSLSGFETMVEDNLIESDFSKSVCELLYKMKSTYSQLEECSQFYENELLDYFNGLEIKEIENTVKQFNEFFSNNNITQVPYSIEGLDSIHNWIKFKIDETNFNADDIVPPDFVNFGDSITFVNVEKEEYRLIIDKLQLDPEDGGQDEVDFCIRDKENSKVVNGSVQVTYGFAEEDEDGGIDYVCDEDIHYVTLEIEDFLEEKLYELQDFENEQELMVNDLKELFNL